ncbi:hypothetical protein D9M71_802200 [compost metagenome]
MSSIALVNIHARALDLAPGFFVSVIVAIAATFLSEHYGAPVMLFALLLGIAMNFLAGDGKFVHRARTPLASALRCCPCSLSASCSWPVSTAPAGSRRRCKASSTNCRAGAW